MSAWNAEVEAMLDWQSEAERLFRLASSSKLRALTVRCPNDHEFLEVRRTSGGLVWRGSAFRRPWKVSVAGRPRLGRATGARPNFGFLTGTIPKAGEGYAPWGSCRCGASRLPRGWLLEQCARTDLRKSRRVAWAFGTFGT